MGYIGFITKGLNIAKKIEALAPTQKLDPKTGKPMLNNEGKLYPQQPLQLNQQKLLGLRYIKMVKK